MTPAFPQTVIFDLDGTLVDTAPDLTAALNAVLTGSGRRALPEEEVRHLVGRGARTLIMRGMEATGGPIDPQEVPALFNQFLDHYGAKVAVRSKPFPGVVETLQRLQRAGCKLGICTNKPEALSLALLDALQLRRFFPVILGADSQPYHKPDPRHLLDAIDKLDGHRNNSVMIGDSETDVLAARAAGVPVVLVSFGYTEIPARELGGDALIDGYDQLEPALAALSRVA